MDLRVTCDWWFIPNDVRSKWSYRGNKYNNIFVNLYISFFKKGGQLRNFPDSIFDIFFPFLSMRMGSGQDVFPRFLKNC